MKLTIEHHSKQYRCDFWGLGEFGLLAGVLVGLTILVRQWHLEGRIKLT